MEVPSDVSILEIGDGVYEVLATRGNNHLGGDDFDEKIVDYIASEFKKENGVDLKQDKMSLQRLKRSCRKGKEGIILNYVNKYQPTIYNGYSSWTITFKYGYN